MAVRYLFDDMFVANDATSIALQLTFTLETGFTNLQFLGMAADAIDMAANAYRRDGGLSGIATGFADLESTIAAVNDGEIYRYISKPWDDEHLKSEIRDAFRTWKERFGGVGD